MKTAAIITAGGSGTRVGSAIPKQFLLLGGIPILVRTLQVFQSVSAVDDIFLVLPSEDVDNAAVSIVNEYALTKVAGILAGGKRRQDSVKNAIEALGNKYDIAVIHDGVRPFVTCELVDMVIREAARKAAVIVGVPVRDTVKKVSAGNLVEGTIERDKLWLVQTPQAFAVPLIEEAYRRAYADNFYGTDDAVLVERMGINVNMLIGSYENIKITTKSDLVWGELLLKMCSGYRENVEHGGGLK